MMSGKYFMIIVFMCACAATVSAGHARHFHPMEGTHKHPTAKNIYSVKGTDNGGDDSAIDVMKRDDLTIPKTPNTVLSVQYDRGFIKELYLSQGVGGSKDIPTWSPSVSEKTQICEDLCRSGLGGDPCGYSCPDRIPTSIRSVSGYTTKKNKWTTRTPRPTSSSTSTSNETESEHTENTAGNPRTDVCPVICEYGLGKPLCECTQTTFPEDIPWAAVCDSFCSSTAGSYQVQGCPDCTDQLPDVIELEVKSGVRSSDIWVQYCREQCRTGNGGAACNCDKIPFFLTR